MDQVALIVKSLPKGHLPIIPVILAEGGDLEEIKQAGIKGSEHQKRQYSGKYYNWELQ